MLGKKTISAACRRSFCLRTHTPFSYERTVFRRQRLKTERRRLTSPILSVLTNEANASKQRISGRRRHTKTKGRFEYTELRNTGGVDTGHRLRANRHVVTSVFTYLRKQ